MKSKNILIISQVFFPEKFPINLIAQNLKKIQYQVKVFTGYPTYPKFNRFFKYFRFYPTISYFNKIEIFRVPIFPRLNNSGIVLTLNYLTFILNGIFFSPFLLYKKKIDYIFVYATSPLLQALVGVFIKKFTKTKLIIWVQDLWPESLEYTGYIKNRFILDLIKKIVAYIYNQCDLILVQSHSFKRSIKKISKKKILVLNNPSIDFFLKSKFRDRKKLNYLYAGNIGKVQSIGKIVEIANVFKENKKINFKIIGSGSESNKIKYLIKKKKLSNVTCKSEINFNSIKKEYKNSDILIAILKSHQLSKKTIPSKIQAYMSTGKPILCCIEGEASFLIKKANCGFTCKNDIESIKKIIKKINLTSAKKLRILGKNGRNYFLNHFSSNIVTLKLDKFLKSLND